MFILFHFIFLAALPAINYFSLFILFIIVIILIYVPFCELKHFLMFHASRRKSEETREMKAAVCHCIKF